MGGKKRLTTQEFVERAKKIHGEKYDYSSVEYKDSKTKVKIFCKKHNSFFMQQPNNHLMGKGCSLCANNVKLSTEEFIKRAELIHGKKYDYGFAEYKNAKTSIKIFCKEHNSFFIQSPNNHLSGKGCSLCANNVKLNTEEFIKRAKKIHGEELYNYSKVEFKGIDHEIEIECKLHGVFWQSAYAHKKGSGCPKCNESKGEKEIAKFFKKYNIEYEFQKKFNDCKHKYKLPFDFYIEEKNILIEFDGKQHFCIVEYFGGKESFEERKKKDEIKTKFAKDNGIKLLRIPYTKFNNIEEILTKKLL